jgi:hypothetical protein
MPKIPTTDPSCSNHVIVASICICVGIIALTVAISSYIVNRPLVNNDHELTGNLRIQGSLDVHGDLLAGNVLQLGSASSQQPQPGFPLLLSTDGSRIETGLFEIIYYVDSSPTVQTTARDGLTQSTAFLHVTDALEALSSWGSLWTGEAVIVLRGGVYNVAPDEHWEITPGAEGRSVRILAAAGMEGLLPGAESSARVVGEPIQLPAATSPRQINLQYQFIPPSRPTFFVANQKLPHSPAVPVVSAFSSSAQVYSSTPLPWVEGATSADVVMVSPIFVVELAGSDLEISIPAGTTLILEHLVFSSSNATDDRQLRLVGSGVGVLANCVLDFDSWVTATMRVVMDCAAYRLEFCTLASLTPTPGLSTMSHFSGTAVVGNWHNCVLGDVQIVVGGTMRACSMRGCTIFAYQQLDLTDSVVVSGDQQRPLIVISAGARLVHSQSYAFAGENTEHLVIAMNGGAYTCVGSILSGVGITSSASLIRVLTLGTASLNPSCSIEWDSLVQPVLMHCMFGGEGTILAPPGPTPNPYLLSIIQVDSDGPVVLSAADFQNSGAPVTHTGTVALGNVPSVITTAITN